MEPAPFRVRPVQPGDIDAAMELIPLANPDYDPASLARTRVALEQVASDRPNPVSDSGIVLVAEERATGRVVGVVTAGHPGKWAHGAYAGLPRQAARQFRERIGEIYEIAVHPDFRRRGLGTDLINAVPRQSAARSWRMALWFFHGEDPQAVAFHQAMSLVWPTGTDLNFLAPGGSLATLRQLDNGLHACIGNLHPDVRFLVDANGTRAIAGVFTGEPWPVSAAPAPGPGPSQRTTKAERKREKRARGRAQG